MGPCPIPPLILGFVRTAAPLWPPRAVQWRRRRRFGQPRCPAQCPASPAGAGNCSQRHPARPSAAALASTAPGAVCGPPDPAPRGPSPQSTRGRDGRWERLPRSHGHTGHSARQTRQGGSCSGPWNDDTEVYLSHEGHSHRLCGQRTDHRVRVPVEHPGKHPPIYSGPSSPLTSALQPRVSPVELLALRTGPPAETSTAVALTCELEWEQAEVNQGQSRDRRQAAGPTHPGVHRKCPTSLQAGPLARLGWQAQGWQPRPLVRFQKLGAQRSQLRPWTLGRHGHCPLLGSQLQWSVDGHCRASVPSRLQVQPVPAEMGTPVKGCTPVKGSPTQWSSPIPTLTVTALSGSLPMEARLAVGTARPLRVV